MLKKVLNDFFLYVFYRFVFNYVNKKLMLIVIDVYNEEEFNKGIEM